MSSFDNDRDYICEKEAKETTCLLAKLSKTIVMLVYPKGISASVGTLEEISKIVFSVFIQLSETLDVDYTQVLN